MRDEVEAEPLREGLHGGRRDGVLPRAAPDHHRGVVGHAVVRRALEVARRLCEERPALEAREARVDLGEGHAREAQHQRGALHELTRTPDQHPVRRRVVLRLLAWPKRVAPHWDLGRNTDAMGPAEARQRRVGDGVACALELLLDADHVPFARHVKSTHRLDVRVDLRGTLQGRHLRLASLEHTADRVAADLERAGDGEVAVSLTAKAQDRAAGVVVQHGLAPRW